MSEGAASSTRELGTDGARCLATDHSAAAKSPVKTTASHLVSAQPIPTKTYVESKGGIYFGHFPWPVPRAEQDEFFAFRAPAGQLRHDHFVTKNRVTVYSLPHLKESAA